VHRREEVKQDEDDRPALPALATGITLGLWIALMLILAFVVVPTAFASCQGVR
jgi:hypothetical protein